MAALAGIAIFLAISALMYGMMSHRVVARAYVDRRLARARGVDGPQAAQESGPALRSNRFSRSGGGLAKTLSNVQTAQRIGDLLERAGWRMSVTEFLGISGVTAMVGLTAARLFFPVLSIPGAIVGLMLPFFLLRRGVKGRRNKFNKQLVEALTLIANSLRAGSGLLQALDQTATQLKAPLADELRRTLHDIQIGAVPDEAFEALNQRMRSDDLDIAVTAIIVQRATGGNLSEVLDNVAHTMRERIRIRGEIKTLTTQQQYSGYMLGALPIFLMIMFYFINSSYMSALFTTTIGHVLLATGAILEGMGVLIIRKIVNIDI